MYTCLIFLSGGSLSLDEILVHEDTSLDVDTLNGSLSFSVWVSFAEIYNEFIYDLLGDEPKAGKQRTALKLAEDCYRNPFIKGNIPAGFIHQKSVTLFPPTFLLMQGCGR